MHCARGESLDPSRDDLADAHAVSEEVDVTDAEARLLPDVGCRPRRVRGDRPMLPDVHAHWLVCHLKSLDEEIPIQGWISRVGGPGHHPGARDVGPPAHDVTL